MATMRDRGAAKALILVDIQRDFMPGGALAVDGGDEILGGVSRLIERRAFDVIVATQDWHPPGHASFASAHEGKQPFDTIGLYGHTQTLWPDHCLQGTPGAALHPGLDWNAVDAIVRKGTDRECDSYSAFRNNWNPDHQRPPTGLAGYLRERGVGEVAVCGLARDVCVRWTAADAADAGFRTRFLWNLTRAVDPSTDEHVRRELESAGIVIET